MFIPEIIYPGTWLQIDDRQVAFELELMIHQLEHLVIQAATTLQMFEAAVSDVHTKLDPRAEWEGDARIRQEVEDQLRAEDPDCFFRDPHDYLFQTQLGMLRRKGELGIAPRAYLHSAPFIHAHSFVLAVDSFGKFLEVICDYDVLPGTVRDVRKKFDESLPGVSRIRNSALHLEDRLRGYLSPQDKEKGRRMEGTMSLGNLDGNKLGYTIDDGSHQGSHQQIEVSQATLSILVDTLNELLSGLRWRGPRRVALG